jgi:flagellar FliL protein
VAVPAATAAHTRDAYKSFLAGFPSSPYSADARQRLAACRTEMRNTTTVKETSLSQSADGSGGSSLEACEAARARARGGHPDPRIFQSTYVPLEGNFTSNLRGGDAFVQIGLGISTYYDTHVTDNVTRNMMAIRSAVIMVLSESDPVDIATFQGKQRLKEALKNAINAVLTNREGFGGIDEVYFTSFVTQ